MLDKNQLKTSCYLQGCYLLFGNKYSTKDSYHSRLLSATGCGSKVSFSGGGGASFPTSSAEDELYINDDRRGSVSGLDDESMKEDPPKRDCRFPSRSSFLSILNIEFGMPLRNLLLRCM